MRVFRVKDEARLVREICQYDNGILTTGGLYHENELEEVTGPTYGVTYNADGRTELPINWPKMLWLDDRDMILGIKAIDFDTTDQPPYIMDDGIRSWEVTEHWDLGAGAYTGRGLEWKPGNK